MNKVIEHTICLHGPAFEGKGYDPNASSFFWKNLEKALRDAARITAYGTSRKVGRPIKQLTDAWALRIEDLGRSTSTTGRWFAAYLPRLGDVAPQLFEQKTLFDNELNPEDTVFDWFGDITRVVEMESRDSHLLDADLLCQLSKYSKASHYGITEATIVTQRYQSEFLHVNDSLGLIAQNLCTEIPQSIRTRIKGVLNTLTYLERGISLNLTKGNRLHVLWNRDDLEPLRDHWGKSVLLEGILQFKANGQPQILIADAIRPSKETDEIWQELPIAGSSIINVAYSIKTKNPLERLSGLLDGFVSDDEFSSLVEALG